MDLAGVLFRRSKSMRTYVRGNCLSPEAQANLTAAGLNQYWLVDDQGMPTEKLFQRQRDIELGSVLDLLMV